MRVMNFWMVEVMRVQVSPSREKVSKGRKEQYKPGESQFCRGR